jgi:FkbM family methyltransferase
MGESLLERRARTVIRRFRALRAIVGSQPMQHVIKTLRGARAVHESARFAALQLGAPRVARYRLKESGLLVFVRHGTRDIDILHEIFGGTPGRQGYEIPSRLAALLDTRRPPRVIDVGANIGLFGAFVLSRWPDARIVAFEPDPANAALLGRMIAANRLTDQWRLVEAAVSTSDGEVSFAGGLFADSHVSEGGDGLRVSMRDLFAEDHDVDLLKMDIEGGEWPILADERLATLGARVLVLEWHQRGSPEPDAQRAAVERLTAAGYSVDHAGLDQGAQGVLWASRKASGPSPQSPH